MIRIREQAIEHMFQQAELPTTAERAGREVLKRTVLLSEPGRLVFDVPMDPKAFLTHEELADAHQERTDAQVPEVDMAAAYAQLDAPLPEYKD